MAKIKTIYVCNHTHTDIGFTDYQDVVFRQHITFVEKALDLIEATDGYPEPARYRWTCETTGPLMKYLRSASPAELKRFKHWNDKGRIDIAAMQYNLTPLLNVEQMHRSLYPLRAIRDEFGFSTRERRFPRKETLASIYSVRPRARAPVSTPVTWDELEAGAEIEDFRIDNVPARIAKVGDLWKRLLQATGRFELRQFV